MVAFKGGDVKQNKVMKATVISISQNKNQNFNEDAQHMTSLEIAELTGKSHYHLMRDIRKMEVGWEKVNGTKFGLVEYRDQKGELRPCYSLTRTETLYIATKFNDEARAKLILRWEELEMEMRERAAKHIVQHPQEIRLLACDEEVLNEADEIIGSELEDLNKYSKYCFTPSEIAKLYGIEGRDLNSFLSDQGIIRRVNGEWELTPKYLHRDLTEKRHTVYYDSKGQRKMRKKLVWTETGREFIKKLIEK